MADAFAKEGALLVIADIETDPLKKAEHEIRASGVEVLAVRTDVGDPGSVAALAQGCATFLLSDQAACEREAQ